MIFLKKIDIDLPQLKLVSTQYHKDGKDKALKNLLEIKQQKENLYLKVKKGSGAHLMCK